MVGSPPPLTTDLTKLPLPRRPLESSGYGDAVRRWYENELGWPTVPADTPRSPVLLRVGPRFDVLDVPAEAGRAALRHLVAGSPVALRGDRMLLLVAAGSAEELPGLLDWLEWGTLALDLRAIGTGGAMEAPWPPGPARGQGHGPDRTAAAGREADLAFEPGFEPAGTFEPAFEPAGVFEPGCRGDDLIAARPVMAAGPVRTASGPRPLVQGRPSALQGAAVWLRPPERGCEVEASLPTMSALGGGGGAPDLVRVVDTVATQCHRLRLRRARPEASAP